MPIINAQIATDLRPFTLAEITIHGVNFDLPGKAQLDTGANQCVLSHSFILKTELKDMTPDEVRKEAYIGIDTVKSKPPLTVHIFHKPTIILYDAYNNKFSGEIDEIGFIEDTSYEYDIVVGCSFLQYEPTFIGFYMFS